MLALREPAKYAQDKVDSTISRLEEIVVSLKRHRNSLSPIGRLPDDILGNIFTQYCLDARSLSKYHIVTDFCSRWRSVALDTPSVWSRIVLTSASPWLVDTVLCRSKATEITIYLDGWVPDASWDVVKPHCNRIAAIICLRHGSKREDITPTLAKKIPYSPCPHHPCQRSKHSFSTRPMQ